MVKRRQTKGNECTKKYLGNQASRLNFIHLPKKDSYRIEMIDVWNMERVVLYEKASGTVRLMLPGREGIAVAAWRIEKEALEDISKG